MYDLLAVTDATASMGSYLNALRTSIPEILALAKLSGAFNRLGVLSYRDYCDPTDQIISWSGWNTDLQDFVQKLVPSGGGDYPEAAKTALIRALQAVDKESQTLILWYADAPPHHVSNHSHLHTNHLSEADAFPKGATDWIKLCYIAKKRNCTVFSFTPNGMESSDSSFYVLLSELTGGISIKSSINSKSSAMISRLTLGTIMQWMGQPSDLEAAVKESTASLMRYEESPLQASPKPSDEDTGSKGYLPPGRSGGGLAGMGRGRGRGFPLREGITGTPLRKMRRCALNSSSIPRGLLAAEPSNLAKRFANPSETAYRETVYEMLGAIIETNVFSLTYNPIFGQLWRAVCRKPGIQQNALLNAFSNRVGTVTDPVQKVGLQQWLDESFDATEEIEAIIAKQGELHSPMVYLDLDVHVDLTRTELLEVSRSCYAGVLKKIAAVFTHLKLVEEGVTLAPNHRSIPLNLNPRDFFRVLPHLAVPGTLYPSRAASITAILALITGVPFLREPAADLLATLKGTWLDIEVPENISFDCARLLLSAPEGFVLTEEEKMVYEAMRRYKLIELNLHSSIEVLVPWTPKKTRNVGDRKIQCKKCLINRSITLMSEKQISVCGLCIPDKNKSKNKDPQAFQAGSDMQSCWVECSDKSCRAQYVIEDAANLRIRPKCYYCRNKIPCPRLECSKCTNRVIVPGPYRTSKDRADFHCMACSNSETVVVTPHITTLHELNKENGVAWLGLPANEDILKGKSAFKLFQVYGPAVFGGPPSPDHSLYITFYNKKIRNPSDALAQVERRVGASEVELGSCALCFEEMSKPKLLMACGRSGCHQKVDDDCLREWYGKSEPGKLLNLMQLACPFCRRKPTVKTLARYNPRATTLGGLQQAMDDRRFFYAWCITCGFAKQSYERVCCNEERLPMVENFRCRDCTPDRSPRVNPIGRVTDCPTCGVAVEKISGCNHIVCQCGQHFCHVCGKACSYQTIYKHMATEHGGAFDDGD